MSNIKITWHGHACFTLEYEGYRVAIDPYDPTTPGYGPLCVSANMLLCSHDHHDHNYAQAVCMPLNELPCPFEIEKLNCYHDEKQGALRGENIIHILSAGGMRIAHFGDLGHLLNDEQIAALGKLDAALVPVGGTYTLDPVQADKLCRSLDARVIIPMHYRSDGFGYDNIAHIDEFLSLRDDVHRIDESALTLTPDTPKMTAVWRGAPTAPMK